MTAPGGGLGESAHDDETTPPAAGSQPSEQPDREAPWEPPAPPPTADYPPPVYPPPGYPPGYPTEYQAGHPGQYAQPAPPPPGYEQPPGYGGPPYLPGPPQFGGTPAGYTPPSYAGGYYPDYQGGFGPQGTIQPGINGLAIASLISSFTGLFCCIGSIVAIVLGTIALDQIKRTRQDGYGLAVAGIVIGIATLLVGFIIAMFALHSR
ncbi:DUF4190 domain-containing protein [Mycobacterium sp.]|uniref:DUF4190 domain-containing protein n=1 Tax=Mycobacterium sp. TaxID=1785 RepID=UPI003C751E44